MSDDRSPIPGAERSDPAFPLRFEPFQDRPMLFVAVIAGHIGAALKHHFIDKDDILTRMLPDHAKEN